ncbi:hypothetical protein AWE51_18785 [Aquimarina aggregata]|uniref:Outer membrane protein beta-barrel domain-containing protein n=1 Tax=Aquimarina aggregata TaxID=1642818 RepID=A0A162WGY7_9FLAO|nr:outer membrane beta-barrel protein [Aquimarina aggregata]KZS38093.1 hypothetical protein AWE51_18785 [Aquimarina aggregata]
MKQKLLIVLITILSFNCYSQIAFNQGYFIDNSDNRTNCLIAIINRKGDTKKFTYKLSENSEEQNINIESVKEFGATNKFKFTRQTVNIQNNINNERKPEFEEKILFLEILIEGNANLYQLVEDKTTLFFLKTDSSNIQQLIFYSYKTPENTLAKVEMYKQQLWDNLKCPNIQLRNISKVNYKRAELANLFVRYNKCTDSNFINYEINKRKKLLKIAIRPGINLSSLEIQNNTSIINDNDFGSSVSLRFGIEAEYTLPIYKNKWAVFVEPTYQYFNSEKEIIVNSISRNIKVNFSSIEIPIGLRHYVSLNKKSKLFLNGAFVFDFGPKSQFDFDSATDLTIKTNSNFAFGIGYNYNKKYSIELRHQTKQDLLSDSSVWSSDFITSSVIFGYSLF